MICNLFSSYSIEWSAVYYDREEVEDWDRDYSEEVKVAVGAILIAFDFTISNYFFILFFRLEILWKNGNDNLWTF